MGIRIAACLDLAPRKLGSIEQWVLGLSDACKQRGHRLHLYWSEPVHGAVAAHLEEAGASWSSLDQLHTKPVRASLELRRSFDVIYLNLVAPRSNIALAAFLAWPVPVLYFDQISGPSPGEKKRSRASRWLDPLTLSRVKGIAGCSHYVVLRDQLRFQFPAERCWVIPNGVDPLRFRPDRENGTKVPVLLAVAYLIPEKGVDVLLAACAEIADLSWRLVVVGDGPELAKLQAQCRSSGLDSRVEFVGLRDDVDQFLRTADICVHPAVWEEAFGLTITEAMASGCATIASAVGGILEIIEHGVSGYLVPPGDPLALAAGLRDLLGDEAQRRALGEAARIRVLERFTLRASVQGQLDWIERCCR